MKKRKRKKKLLCLAIVFGLIMASGIPSFSDEYEPAIVSNEVQEALTESFFFDASDTVQIGVTAPIFPTLLPGGGPPATLPIEIRNFSSVAATGVNVSLSGVDPGAFLVTSGVTVIPGGVKETSWTIQPAPGLATGMYRADIIVTSDNGGLDKSEVVFFVADDVLQEVTWYLSEIIPQRIYGTPGEREGCDYVEEQFRKYTTPANGWHIWAERIDPYNTYQVQDGLMQRNTPQRVGQINIDGQRPIYGRPNPAFSNAIATANGNLIKGGFEGLFFDFGVYDTRTGVTGPAMAAGLKFPTAEEVAANGGKVYGTIRFHRNASGMLPSAPDRYTSPSAFNAPTHIAAVRDAIISATGAEVTGLFVAVSDAGGNHDMAGQYMELGSSVPSVGMTAVAANFSPTFLTLSLRQLEEVKKAGERGIIQGVDRYFVDRTFNTYAVKKANTDKPDLALVFIAHIDGVFCSPSANDNGASVAALIEMARHFDKIDTGNVELIFAAVGGEEFAGFQGAASLGWLLDQRGVGDISIAWSMDMISAKEGSDTQWGGKVDTFNVGVYMGTNNYNEPVFNLSSHLVLTHARDSIIPGLTGGIWEPGRYGINDAYFINYHNSDHEMMNHFGVDSARIVLSGRAPITGASTANSMETRYHTAQDTFDENYGYERNRMSMNFLLNGALKALELDITKRAQFTLTGNIATLANADRLFKAFDKIEVTLKNSGLPDIKVTLDKDNTTFEVPAGYRIAKGMSVLAYGTGVAAHTNRTDIINRLGESAVFMTYLDPDGAPNIVTDRQSGPFIVVEAPVWDTAPIGYGADARRALALQIHNIGDTEARLTWPGGLTPAPSPSWPTAISATNGWSVSGTGGRIVAGGTHQRWTLQPPAGLGIGVHQSVVTVRYREGLTGTQRTATGTAYFVVGPQSGAPVITSGNSLTLMNNLGGTFLVEATGNTPMTFGLTGSPPAGVTIDSTGLLTIAPTVPAGTYNFNITISNGRLPNTSQPFSLTITSAPTVYASIGAKPVAHVKDLIEYELILREAVNVLGIDLEFVVDGDMLISNSFETLNGFTALEPIDWTDNGDGTWTGAVKFGFPALEDSLGFTSNDPVSVAKIVFSSTGLLGEADLTITNIAVTGVDPTALNGAGEVVFFAVVVEVGQNTTLIENRYDLNKDGKIDLLDLGIMLLYVGYNEDDPDWDTLIRVYDKFGVGIKPKDCDVNGDGEVDMGDLIELLANFD